MSGSTINSSVVRTSSGRFRVSEEFGAVGIPLSSLNHGEEGIILALPEDPEYRGQLIGMGLPPGALVRVVQHRKDSSRPLVLASGQTRIAMGEEIARFILVEKNRDQGERK